MALIHWDNGNYRPRPYQGGFKATACGRPMAPRSTSTGTEKVTCKSCLRSIRAWSKE